MAVEVIWGHSLYPVHGEEQDILHRRSAKILLRKRSGGILLKTNERGKNRVSSLKENQKRGLGLVHHAGKKMVWGKGAVAGGFVFLSGSEARTSEDDIPPRGIKEQTELALERIKVRLEEAGTTLENAVKFVWYITDRSQELPFYEARDAWLAKHAPKLLEERSYASTLLIVGLARYDMLVEIDCIAYMP